LYLGICGTETFLLWIKDLLTNHGINSIRVTKDNGSNAYTLCISGRWNMCKFYNYIYDDATCILGRKKDKFMNALLELKQPLNISLIGELAQKM
jgi:hypothetical protein